EEEILKNSASGKDPETDLPEQFTETGADENSEPAKTDKETDDSAAQSNAENPALTDENQEPSGAGNTLNAVSDSDPADNEAKNDAANPAETKEDGIKPQALSVPEDAVASGNAGVNWYVDKNNVLYFEAGELNRTDTWRKYARNITEIRVIPTETSDQLILPENCNQLFQDLRNLQSVETSKFNTANVTAMQRMFYNCTSLTSLDLSSFNTSNVHNMYGMFYNCSSLADLNISSFNTSAVSDFGYMFAKCSSLTDLNLSGFNTSRADFMASMFYGCSSLTSLDLSSFNTGSVSRMDNMFNGCSSLRSVDLSNFNTGKVKYAYGSENMFLNCSSLQKMNLSGSFFNGHMSNAYPYTLETMWMQVDNTANRKTWPQMVQSWNNTDPGWWTLAKEDCILTF
ncbi:MAG: BspA family leucine-rich repeat surface protein, partial [Erysipelotrichaceae bacterium]|nr:BspA family leucine-rich repeat surface protein [Erysipelotrichaceae bacterium]